MLEYKNCRIQKFDKNGKYVLTIGRQGQGPGEFERPNMLFLNRRTGNICVRDSRRIDLFDNNGNYLDGIVFQSFPTSFAFDSDGNIWGKFSKGGKMGASSSISMATSQGKLLKEVIDFPIEASSSSSGGLELYITHGYEYNLFFSDLDMQTFVYAYSKDYELNVFNKEGELLYKIRKDEPPLSFSSDIKNKIRKRYKRLPKSARDSIRFPDYFPFFDAIFADDVGHIYVKRIQTAVADENIYEYDIFSEDGYYLYNTKFLKLPRIIKNGFFYIFEADDETGIESVKRFKISNWDQIKKEK